MLKQPLQNLDGLVDEQDGFHKWIKQTLQDCLTGAEFDKLTKFASNLSKEDFLQNSPLGMMTNMLMDNIFKANKSNISEQDKQELISLESKAREILINQANFLEFDEFKNLLKCAHIKQNTLNQNTSRAGIYLETDKKVESKEESSQEIQYKGDGFEMLRQNLTGKEFREFIECVENDKLTNDGLFDKAKKVLSKGLESYPILVVLASQSLSKKGYGLGDFFGTM